MTRVFVMELYEKLINISFGWDKEYNWHELKPILMFFTVFANTNSIRDLELRAKNPNTHRMMDKYMFIKNRG
ncbi:MAG: hypothetical protein IPG00_15835 [Saprospiraceae bacterium]|nr:hypothetical protein [Saprospiraceae bacterium]